MIENYAQGKADGLVILTEHKLRDVINCTAKRFDSDAGKETTSYTSEVDLAKLLFERDSFLARAREIDIFLADAERVNAGEKFEDIIKKPE